MSNTNSWFNVEHYIFGPKKVKMILCMSNSLMQMFQWQWLSSFKIATVHNKVYLNILEHVLSACVTLFDISAVFPSIIAGSPRITSMSTTVVGLAVLATALFKFSSE